jgi:hypothetical protein
MDRVVRLLTLAAAALLASQPQLAAAQLNASSEANTVVLKPLTVLKIEDLDFGSLMPSATAGTAVVNPFTGAVTTTGGVTAVPGATSAAAFAGVGTRRAPVIIRVPRNPITITRIGGTETMIVSDFTLDGNSTRHINAFEVFHFQVGARLDVGANQADGTYVGTFDVTVQYP